MVNLEKYREYNPYTEAILVCGDELIVIDRYGVNDYGAWATNEEHLYDETYGTSTRGGLESVLHDIKNCIS